MLAHTTLAWLTLYKSKESMFHRAAPHRRFAQFRLVSHLKDILTALPILVRLLLLSYIHVDNNTFCVWALATQLRCALSMLICLCFQTYGNARICKI